MNEKDVIQKFLEKYNSFQDECFLLSEKPDKLNREKKDIDAIFTSKNGNCIALEHTQVLSFLNQNWDSSKLLKAINEQEDTPSLRGIKLFLPTPIPPSPDWQDFLQKIIIWIDKNLSTISQGLSTYKIPLVPFEVNISNDGSTEPFSISRFLPDSSDTHKSLEKSMIDGLKHIEEKLQAGPRPGHTTILLMELIEIGMQTTSLGDRYLSWLRAEKSYPGKIPDQVWLAVTHESSGQATFLCYHGPHGLMKNANPPQFRYGDSAYWNPILASIKMNS